MQAQPIFHPFQNYASSNFTNPETETLPLKNKLQSFRLRPTIYQPSNKINLFEKDKQIQNNPIYIGLQTQQKSKINLKNVGPWFKPEIQKSTKKISEDTQAQTQNKVKIIPRLSQHKFYPKKTQSNQLLTINFKEKINPQKNSNENQKVFIKMISVRKAIIQQEEDSSVELPKIRNQKQVKKLKSLSNNKLLPITNEYKNGLLKVRCLQMRKTHSQKSLQNIGNQKGQFLTRQNTLKSLVQKKLNGTLLNFNISLLKPKNIELNYFQSPPKLKTIIQIKKKI